MVSTLGIFVVCTCGFQSDLRSNIRCVVCIPPPDRRSSCRLSTETFPSASAVCFSSVLSCACIVLCGFRFPLSVTAFLVVFLAFLFMGASCHDTLVNKELHVNGSINPTVVRLQKFIRFRFPDRTFTDAIKAVFRHSSPSFCAST